MKRSQSKPHQLSDFVSIEKEFTVITPKKLNFKAEQGTYEPFKFNKELSIEVKNNLHGSIAETDYDPYRTKKPLMQSLLSKEDETAIEGHEVIIEELEQPKYNASGYILFIALGIHATFAGLALGLTGNIKEFVGMLIAILAHKWAEALSMGINFLKDFDMFGWTNRIVCLIIFSLATPVGMLIGMF